MGYMNPSKTLSITRFTGLAFIFFLAAGAGITFVYQGLIVSYPFQLDYGEGPLLNHALRLATGEMIYQPDLDTPPYTITNYPPIYLLVLAAGRLALPNLPPFLIGRSISVFSTLAAALAIAAIIQRGTTNRIAGLVGGLAFLCLPFTMYWTPLLRVDMLALGLSLWGLYLAIRSPNNNLSLTMSAALLIGAIYTRQSYALAAPLAAFVHLFMLNKRKALIYGAGIGSVSLLLFLLFNLISEGGFFTHTIIANMNSYQFERGILFLVLFAKSGILVLLGTMPMLIFRQGKYSLRPFMIAYFIGSLASGLTAGKVGSAYNYLLEISAACAIGFGFFYNYLGKFTPRWLLYISLHSAMVILAIISMTRFQVSLLTDLIKDRERMIELASESIRLARQAGGIVISDQNHTPILGADQPIYIQSFERTQMSVDGSWDSSPFIEELKNQKFSMVIVMDNFLADQMWTPQAFEALQEGYEIKTRLGESDFYYPRSAK